MAALMVLSVFLSAGVFGAGDQSITIGINQDSGINSLEGVTSNAYQVLAPESGQDTYMPSSGFNNFFSNAETQYDALNNPTSIYINYDATNHRLNLDTTQSDGDIAIDVSTSKLDDLYFASDLLSRLTQATDVQAMAAWMAQYVEDTSISAENSTTGTADAQTMTIDDLAGGYYLVVSTSQNNDIVIQNSILNLAEASDITLKAENYTVNKDVNGQEESSTASVGDTVNYTISGTIPAVVENDNLTEFKITDTLTNQKLDVTSFKLTIGTPGSETNLDALLTEGGKVISNYETGSQSFTLTFDPVKLTDHRGEDFVLTYTAKLMDEAVARNGNDVTVTFSNNDSTTTATSHTDVYTYGFEFDKVFSDDSNNFSAVTFNLYKTGGDGNKTGEALKVAGLNGAYTVAEDQTTATNTALTPNSDTGNLQVTGLAAGTYVLEEQAISGYKAATVKITLTGDSSNLANLDANRTTATVNDESVNVTLDNAGIGTNDTNNNTISLAGGFEVLNQKTTFGDLPNTGAMGTTLLTIGGIVLIVAAAGGLMIARKKSAK